LEEINNRVNAIGIDHYLKFHHTTPNSRYAIPNSNDGTSNEKENIADLFTFHRDFFNVLGVNQVSCSVTAGTNYSDFFIDSGLFEFSIPFKKANNASVRPDFYGSLEMKSKYPVTITPNPVLQNTDTILVTISPPLDRYY